MSIKTGWIEVSGQSTRLKVIAKGERLHILSYHPFKPYIHSIMWVRDCPIIDLWYKEDHLYSIDEERTLKIWQWKRKLKRFDCIGTINNTECYRINKDKIEIEHLNGKTYLYESVNGKIVKITPNVWRPNQHHLFPEDLQERINVFWEVWGSQQTVLSELPPELMVCISSVLATGQTGF